MPYFQLSIAVFAPAVLAMIFYHVRKAHWYGQLPKWAQQAVIGVAFGILACLASQFGVQKDGFMLTVRNAVPIVAGFVFGAPAGLIAGVMGGAYRAAAGLLWGMGEYTWLACSLSTMLAGLYVAFLSSYFFKDVYPVWYQGAFAALSVDALHMLLIYITHMQDMETVYRILSVCTVPTLICNCLAVSLALVAIHLVSGKGSGKGDHHNYLPQLIGKRLYCVTIAAFLITSLFIYHLQDDMCMDNAENLLETELHDMEINMDDISGDRYNSSMQILYACFEDIGGELVDVAETAEDELRETLRIFLQHYVTSFNFNELFLVDRGGTILLSTSGQWEGSPMENLCTGYDKLGNEVSIFVRRTEDGQSNAVYMGIPVEEKGFIVAAFDEDVLNYNIRMSLANIAEMHHVGKNGLSLILDASTGEIVSLPEDSQVYKDAENLLELCSEEKCGSLQKVRSRDGVDYVYMADLYGDYYFVTLLPMDDVVVRRNLTVYISIFTMQLVFTVVFLFVFQIVQRYIVKDIHVLNTLLGRIAAGRLDTRVELSGTYELQTLAADINTTVDTLKKYIAEASARIDRELALARTIQSSTLPSKFPAYPDCNCFDIYANTEPAHEVGGDFYDYSFVDGNTFYFLIADVSGKGIPAAMFMMRVRTLIKSFVEAGKSPGEAFTQVNDKLCSGKDPEMFVTVWMAYLNLKTGVLTYCNAGHNPPVLLKKGEPATFLRARSGLVLAGLGGIQYRENRITLEPGDQLYLYTDGVTEAFNPQKEMFGEERLLGCLNRLSGLDARELCGEVYKEMEAFVGEADQFDDITMLCMQYRKPITAKEDKA